MPTPYRVRHADGKYVWRVKLRPGGRKGYTTSRTGGKADMMYLCKLVDAMGPERALRHYDSEQSRVSGVTLDDVIEQFFEWKLTGTRKVRSARTVVEYRSNYRLWIQPLFGQRPAGSVSDGEVQIWVDGMTDGSLARSVRPSAYATQPVSEWGESEPVPAKALDPKTVHDRYNLLKQIYDWLNRPGQRERWGVELNPCRDIDLPTKTKKPPKGMRPAEWQQLWPHLVDESRDAAEFALFLLSTGWRVSTAAALDPDDVEDYGPDGMWITQNFVWRFVDPSTVERVEDTKGEGSRGRRIRVDEIMAAVVRRRLQSVPSGGLVFTTPKDHHWDPRNFINNYWNPAVALAGLTRRPTPHWLRHSQANWMLMTGKASITEVQRRIGHRQSTTTVDGYGRMIEDVPVAAIEAFVQMRGAVELPGLPPSAGRIVEVEGEVVAAVEDDAVAEPSDDAAAGDGED